MKCSTKYCRNQAYTGERKCCKCRARTRKERSPVSYWFEKARWNARRRGKQWLLTLDDFREFCERTSYLILKGRHGPQLSIDRIDGSGGYSRDNIRTLSVSDNARKH